MKLDKKTVDALSSLPDDRLWQMISLIASTSGIRMPKGTPDKETMAGLRNAVSGLSDSDYARAAEIFAKYKEGKVSSVE